jgi:hypothetical protein
MRVLRIIEMFPSVVMNFRQAGGRRHGVRGDPVPVAPLQEHAKSVAFPAKRPDLDKLVRSVLDGLSDGGAFDDDSQVASL